MFSAGARQIHVWPHGAEQPWLNQLGDSQMKLTKLLTGAAVAALLTGGAANAQLVATVGDFDASADTGFASGQTDLASELILVPTSGTPAISGSLEVQMAAG